VGIKVEKPLRLFLQRAHELDEQHVFHDVRKISGVELMAVVHELAKIPRSDAA
jgi:hypothetical protein